jgi:hypothetical protein
VRLPWRRGKEGRPEEPPGEGKAPEKPAAGKGAQIVCPFCKVPLSQEHRKNCPALKEVGTLLSLEDYTRFQHIEATPTDLESLVTLERIRAWGEVPRRGADVMKYVMAIGVGLLVVGIAFYILKSLGVIP